MKNKKTIILFSILCIVILFVVLFLTISTMKLAKSKETGKNNTNTTVADNSDNNTSDSEATNEECQEVLEDVISSPENYEDLLPSGTPPINYYQMEDVDNDNVDELIPVTVPSTNEEDNVTVYYYIDVNPETMEPEYTEIEEPIEVPIDDLIVSNDSGSGDGLKVLSDSVRDVEKKYRQAQGTDEYSEPVMSGIIHDFDENGIPEIFLSGTSGDESFSYGYTTKKKNLSTTVTDFCQCFSYKDFFICVNYSLDSTSDTVLNIYQYTNEDMNLKECYILHYAPDENGDALIYEHDITKELVNYETSKTLSADEFIQLMKNYQLKASCDVKNDYTYFDFSVDGVDAQFLPHIEGADSIIEVIYHNGNISYVTAYEKLYKPVLDMYFKAFNEGNMEYSANGFSVNPVFAYATNNGTDISNVNYGFYDIDSNGIPELCIGAYNQVYDMYALSNDEIVNVFSGGERSTYTLFGNGYIYNIASGSAAQTYFSLYNYANGSLNFMEGTVFDGFLDEKNPYFYTTDEKIENTASYNSISESEATNWQNNVMINDKATYWKHPFSNYNN